jgi:thiosulfate reductase cytochrome b subunit
MFNSRKYNPRYYPTQRIRYVKVKRFNIWSAILTGLMIGGLPLVAALIKSLF